MSKNKIYFSGTINMKRIPNSHLTIFIRARLNHKEPTCERVFPSIKVPLIPKGNCLFP